MFITQSKLKDLEERIETLERRVAFNNRTNHFNVSGSYLSGYDFSRALSTHDVLLLLLKHLGLKLSVNKTQLTKSPKLRKDKS